MRKQHVLTVGLFSAFALCATLGASQKAYAQLPKGKKEELKLSIQVRPRAEVRNGVFTPIMENQNPATFVSQRNRLGLTYTKRKFSTKVNLQMLNVWGSEAQIQRNATSVGVFEAWGQLRLSRSSSLRLGRQVFSYDDERILGALGWNQAGRKHDAALYKLNKKRFKLDVGAAFNQNSERVSNSFYSDSASQPYKSMQFLWAKYIVSDAFSLSALAMNLHMQSRFDSSLSDLQTMGLNAYYSKKKLSAMASFYYQLGTNNSMTAAIKSRNAFLASLSVKYAATKKFSMRIGSDYVSGRDMNSTSNENTAFNPLYGTHHKFYGYMDLFYVGNPHSNVGLWDNYLSATLKVKKKTAFSLAYHHFNSAAQIVNAQGVNMSSNLGDEIDLTFSHKIDKGVKLVGGYSQMIPSTSLEMIKGIAPTQAVSSYQSWLWLSLIINPQIIIK